MLNTLQEFEPIIKSGFETRFEHDKRIKLLNIKHLDPEKNDRKEDWDKLATTTGIDKEDLKIDYAKYRRERETDAMEEDERNRILDNRRILDHAQRKGQMGDLFINQTSDDYVPLALQGQAEAQAEETKAAT